MAAPKNKKTLSASQRELDSLATSAGLLTGRYRLTFLMGALAALRAADRIDMGHRADLLVTLTSVVRAMRSTDPKNPLLKEIES